MRRRIPDGLCRTAPVRKTARKLYHLAANITSAGASAFLSQATGPNVQVPFEWQGGCQTICIKLCQPIPRKPCQGARNLKYLRYELPMYPVDRGPLRTQLALLQELHIKCIGCPPDSCFLYPTFNTSVLRAAGHRPQPVSRQPIPFALSHLNPLS